MIECKTCIHNNLCKYQEEATDLVCNLEASEIFELRCICTKYVQETPTIRVPEEYSENIKNI